MKFSYLLGISRFIAATAQRDKVVVFCWPFRKSFLSQCVFIPCDLDIVWAAVEISIMKINLGVCCRPPTVCSNFVDELHDVINIVSSRYPTLALFLLGDFNIPNISCNSEPSPL
ncbi:unnamed protein product [Ixodes pacificus]